MQHVCKAQHKGATDSKETLQGTPKPMEFIAMDLIGEFHPPPAKETGMHSWQYAC